MKLDELVDFLADDSDFDVLYEGSKVRYINEAGTPDRDSAFFVAGHEHGAHVLIHVAAYHGDGFETAWDVWIDESVGHYAWMNEVDLADVEIVRRAK